MYDLSTESHFVGVHVPYELHRKEKQIECTAFAFLSDAIHMAREHRQNAIQYLYMYLHLFTTKFVAVLLTLTQKCHISQISNVQKVRHLEQPAPDGWRTEQKPRYDPVQTSKFGEWWSPALQQLWPWSRSKVKVIAWCRLKGLVTRIMHAKYQCSIINTSEDMSQVKVFVMDRQTDRGTDRRTNEF